jgi:hypothetical protein
MFLLHVAGAWRITSYVFSEASLLVFQTAFDDYHLFGQIAINFVFTSALLRFYGFTVFNFCLHPLPPSPMSLAKSEF